MSKRNREIDYAVELERNYARWDEVFTKGGSDPFWSDRVNLELIRRRMFRNRTDRGRIGRRFSTAVILK